MKIRYRIIQLSTWILVLPLLSIAQNKIVKGSIADSSSRNPIPDVTISILKDNKAIATTFSNPKGIFNFENIPPGTYQLYLSLLGYQPHQSKLVISQASINLGKILMLNKSITLRAIEIKQSIPPVTIKKDTLEFNAGSYKTRPNAVVEDLLKQVPGVFIDQSGKITAHGETVKRILVDGKPFFGDNTTLTTQNLPAEIIDKIQLIDSKSDQAQFSGFDDGNREKVINITLKKDRRRGVTATSSLGAGTNDRFAANANVNSFNEQDRISAIGNGNNLNDRNYNPGNNTAGMLPATGLLRNWSGALNYNLDNKKKLRLDASYETVNTKTRNDNTSFRQTFLPDTSWYYQQQNNTTSHSTDHTLHMRLNYKINDAQSILINPDISYNLTGNIQNNKYESLNSTRDPSIAGHSINTGNQSTPNINIHSLYRKRFKKAGQTFSADFTIGTSNTKGTNTYQTKDQYLFTDSISSYNRLTSNKTNNLNTKLRLSYTIPITQNRLLEVSYAWNNQINNVTNHTYDIDSTSGKYEHPNDSLSNISKNNFQTQTAGVQINTRKKGYDYTLGLNTQYNLMNTNNSNSLSFHQHYLNLYPTASLKIAISKSKNLRFNYEGNTTLPTIQQLQPLPNLVNSLLIQEGNPDLKPSFRHRMSIGYNTINMTTYRGFFATVNTELIRNKIVNITRYDTSGHQYTKPVNANGALNINGFITNSIPLKSIHASLNILSGVSYNKDVTFTLLDNNLKSYTHNLNLNESLYFTYKYKSIIDLYTILQATYSGTRYGALSSNNTNYYNYNLFLSYNYYLPAGLIIGNDIRYILNRGRAAGYNTNVVLLNGYIAKTLFKEKQALVKLYGYDLLHQNVSTTRNIGDNYIEDVKQTVLQPYVMISFTWYFKNYPTGKAQMEM